jgi:hypothetical protein
MIRASVHGAGPFVRSTLCSLLAVALANCSPQTDRREEQPRSSAPPALAACQRADVQEVVGKEARGKLFKSILPRLLLQEWMGLDTRRAIADFDQAKVSFNQVALDKPNTLVEPPYQQIVCTAHVQIDMSNATAGQQIVGIDGLRWVINISGQPSDPARDAFTVDVDDVSIQQGLTINGRSPVQAQSQEQDQSAPEADAGDADGAAANSAADDAARAAAEAHAAAAQAEAEIGSAPQAPTQLPENDKPSSEEDLYAPH